MAAAGSAAGSLSGTPPLATPSLVRKQVSWSPDGPQVQPMYLLPALLPVMGSCAESEGVARGALSNDAVVVLHTYRLCAYSLTWQYNSHAVHRMLPMRQQASSSCRSQPTGSMRSKCHGPRGWRQATWALVLLGGSLDTHTAGSPLAPHACMYAWTPRACTHRRQMHAHMDAKCMHAWTPHACTHRCLWSRDVRSSAAQTCQRR